MKALRYQITARHFEDDKVPIDRLAVTLSYILVWCIKTHESWEGAPSIEAAGDHLLSARRGQDLPDELKEKEKEDRGHRYKLIPGSRQFASTDNLDEAAGVADRKSSARPETTESRPKTTGTFYGSAVESRSEPSLRMRTTEELETSDDPEMQKEALRRHESEASLRDRSAKHRRKLHVAVHVLGMYRRRSSITADEAKKVRDELELDSLPAVDIVPLKEDAQE